jgi:N-acetylglutamate synthase-like GNAT family acetyltransferase
MTSPTSTDVMLRPGKPGDIDSVRALLAAAQLPLDGLEEQFGESYAVAEQSGRIVGVEGMERYGSSGLLRSAAVADDWRGRGLGERLTEDRLRWARQAGLSEVWLLTTTAAGYFPRFGFRIAERASAPGAVQESREFRDACPASAVAMRLAL